MGNSFDSELEREVHILSAQETRQENLTLSLILWIVR